jgi:apolipoprotein N-acyltransferase
MVLNGADFLVGITNDTWFGRSVGIHMHSRIFVTRIVENRCWAARVANSGLTYIVDNYGRIRGQLGLYEVAAMRGKVGMRSGQSFFTKVGDVAGRFSFLLTVCISGILCVVWALKKVIPQRFKSSR